MRIAALGLSHETNTFAPTEATLDRWLSASPYPVEGEDVIAQFADAEATMSGYLEIRSEPGVEVVPLVFSKLTPMNTISAEAFEFLVGRMLEMLEEHGPWDAVLLAQHGAAVSEEYPDADGEVVRRVRALVGPDVPIGMCLDMHANVSRQMVDEATVTATYMTNPHLDPRVRARHVADLIVQTVRGEVRPVSHLEMPPLAVDILRQGTGDYPMRDIVALAHEAASRPGVLSVSVAEGFPWADVEEMGMSFLVVTDDDPALAEEISREIARKTWDLRDELVGSAWDIDEALVHASQATSHPVVLLDVGDNVGGGGPGDSTHVLAAAQRLGIRGLFQSLSDPEAVQACIAAGVGATVELQVGGKTDDLHGSPVSIRGTVRILFDGKWEDPGDTHGGFLHFNSGPSAVVYTEDGHTLLLVSRRMGNSSRQQLVSVGIDPLTQPIIVAKGVHSPRGAFEPIAAEMIWLASPGCTSADLSGLVYHRRRVPMFPFEPDTTY
ncbi:MAG TPA: M81 family metallopeptidase [Acidimicrobiia bacterium]|nr:M81 family metallopeptidase [Acidimicrobiia bacterium]